MMLKKCKEDICWEVRSAVQQQLVSGLTTVMYQHGRLDDFKAKLMEVIANSVAEGVRVTLNNIYTDNEFERDLGLNK